MEGHATPKPSERRARLRRTRIYRFSVRIGWYVCNTGYSIKIIFIISIINNSNDDPFTSIILGSGESRPPSVIQTQILYIIAHLLSMETLIYNLT